MHPILLTAWLACQALDASSTAIALRVPGAHEANPIMQHGRIPIRIGVNVGALVLAHRAHTRERAIVAGAFAASGCIAGAWNLAQLRGR